MEQPTVILLEDESLVSVHIKSMIEQLEYHVAAVCKTADEAIDAAKRHQPDIAILDINIKGPHNGIYVGEVIRSEFGIPCIYLTDYTSLETFELAKKTKPASYLNKPVSLIDLKRSIDLAMENARPADASEMTSTISDAIYVRHNGKRTRLNFEDVGYFEADGTYCHIYAKDQKLTLAKPMGSVLSELSRIKGSGRFIQISRSYVVNSDQVSEVQGNQLMVFGELLQVSKGFRDTVMEQFPSV